jgi:hypothetical protein
LPKILTGARTIAAQSPRDDRDEPSRDGGGAFLRSRDGSSTSGSRQFRRAAPPRRVSTDQCRVVADAPSFLIVGFPIVIPSWRVAMHIESRKAAHEFVRFTSIHAYSSSAIKLLQLAVDSRYGSLTLNARIDPRPPFHRRKFVFLAGAFHPTRPPRIAFSSFASAAVAGPT